MALLVLTVSVASGCDSTFEPFDDHDYPFSMTGYLDPAADTQWIRVMPLRPMAGTNDDPVDAVVMLEELETGRTIEFNYRLTAIPSPILQESEFNAQNFWTDEPVRIGHRYRLTATRSDGNTSSALIDVPDADFSVTHILDYSPGIYYRDRLHIEGISSLAYVFRAHSVPQGCNYPLREHLQFQLILERPSDLLNPYIAALYWPPSGRPSYISDPPDCSPLALGPLRYRVVSSGSTWPFHHLVTDIEFSHPSVAGNVDNGVGFVPGLLSVDFPDQGCTRLNLALLTCEITFGPESAVIKGNVIDSCQGTGVDDATVSLAEVAGRWSIDVGVEEDGSFRVEGVDPGREYQLRVSATGYESYAGVTLVLDPKEVRAVPQIALTAVEPEC